MKEQTDTAMTRVAKAQKKKKKTVLKHKLTLPITGM